MYIEGRHYSIEQSKSTIANTVFSSKPNIGSDILAKAFQVDKSIADQHQT